MAIDSTLAHVVLEPLRRRSSTRPPSRRSCTSSTPAEARKVLDDVQAGADRQAARRRGVDHRPGRRRRRPRAHRRAGRRSRAAARDPLHARRRLGPRQRRHPRPARARARRRRGRGASCSSSTTARPRRTTRSRSSRPTRPPSGSSARAPTKGSTRPHGGRRRLRRRQHDRRADAPGQASAATSRFVHQSMYYPVTDAAMDTDCYASSPTGYYLTAKAMAWFWDAYLPDLERRAEITASPLRASDRATRRAAAGAS